MSDGEFVIAVTDVEKRVVGEIEVPCRLCGMLIPVPIIAGAVLSTEGNRAIWFDSDNADLFAHEVSHDSRDEP